MKTKLKNDMILIAVILIAAISVLLIFKNSLKSGGYAQISVNGKVIYSLPLDTDTQKNIETENGNNSVLIKDGKASVISADCPDKICVDHRSVSNVGETIVCLPHKLVVEITEKG